MENTVFDQLQARLQDAAVTTWLTTVGSPTIAAIKTIAWFEDQVEDLREKDPASYAIDFPAILIEFSDTKFDKRNSNKQEGSGTVRLHIVQVQIGKDGRAGASTLTNWKDVVAYINSIVNVIDGFKAVGSATSRFILEGTQMDHKNSAIRDDVASFHWTQLKRKPSTAPGFPT